jgi:hypothetical protein
VLQVANKNNINIDEEYIKNILTNNGINERYTPNSLLNKVLQVANKNNINIDEEYIKNILTNNGINERYTPNSLLDKVLQVANKNNINIDEEYIKNILLKININKSIPSNTESKNIINNHINSITSEINYNEQGIAIDTINNVLKTIVKNAYTNNNGTQRIKPPIEIKLDESIYSELDTNIFSELIDINHSIINKNTDNTIINRDLFTEQQKLNIKTTNFKEINDSIKNNFYGDTSKLVLFVDENNWEIIYDIQNENSHTLFMNNRMNHPFIENKIFNNFSINTLNEDLSESALPFSILDTLENIENNAINNNALPNIEGADIVDTNKQTIDANGNTTGKNISTINALNKLNTVEVTFDPKIDAKFSNTLAQVTEEETSINIKKFTSFLNYSDHLNTDENENHNIVNNYVINTKNPEKYSQEYKLISSSKKQLDSTTTDNTSVKIQDNNINKVEYSHNTKQQQKVNIPINTSVELESSDNVVNINKISNINDIKITENYAEQNNEQIKVNTTKKNTIQNEIQDGQTKVEDINVIKTISHSREPQINDDIKKYNFEPISNNQSNIVEIHNNRQNSNNNISKSIQHNNSFIFREVNEINFPKIVHNFANNIALNSTGIAKIILNPEALGSVFVQIDMSSSIPQITFKAENRNSLVVIESNIESLKEMFASSGVKNIEFTFDKFSSDNGNNNEDKNWNNKDFERNSEQNNQSNHNESQSKKDYLNIMKTTKNIEIIDDVLPVGTDIHHHIDSTIEEYV